MNQTNKVSFIKLSANTDGKISLVSKIVNIALNFWEIALSDTEIKVLSYFMVYGINNQCKELIVKANICKNTNNVNTIMSKLKRLTLIYKDELNGKNYVCKALTFDITSKICFLLKIENK